MSRPAHLRAVADSLRAIARATAADFAGLDAHVGPATWQGPAAGEARRQAFGMGRTALDVSVGLRRAAEALDLEAVAVAAREAAAEAEARADALLALAEPPPHVWSATGPEGPRALDRLLPAPPSDPTPARVRGAG